MTFRLTVAVSLRMELQAWRVALLKVCLRIRELSGSGQLCCVVLISSDAPATARKVYPAFGTGPETGWTEFPDRLV